MQRIGQMASTGRPVIPRRRPSLRLARVLSALVLLEALAVLSSAGCAAVRPTNKPEITADAGPGDAGVAGPVVAAPPKARALSPVPLWKDGKMAGEFDAAQVRTSRETVIDLGEEWVPYIFTERSMPNEQPVPQSSYRATYLALARGEFPADTTACGRKKTATSSSTESCRR